MPWLAAFFFFVLTASSGDLPPRAAFPVLAITGLAWHAWRSRRALGELLHAHAMLFAAAFSLAAAIVFAELAAWLRDAPTLLFALPAQAWLPLCLPPLVLFLRDERARTAVTVVFAIVCAWHFVAVPVEGITGWKLAWAGPPPPAREAGPFHYQASGLAFASYLFPGLFLPLFYLAFGPWAEGQLAPHRAPPKGAWPLLAIAWLLPVAAVQSRSAFFGAALAALVILGASRRIAVAALLAAAAAIGWWLLFSHNKSGVGLRLAYLAFYVDEALRWPAVLTGHGAISPPPYRVLEPGSPALTHSHNDLVQVLYTSGLFALAAYLVFWAALLRDVQVLWRRGLHWPLAAVVAFVPSLVTDVGYHLFEKACFLVLLAAWCLAFRNTPAR